MRLGQTLDIYRSLGPPVDDLAREAWLMERAAEGHVSLLVTTWKGPVVVLGYAQDPEEADLEWCRGAGVPVLRRLTGGTGVIHRGDLGVGLVLPQGHPWAAGIVGLYGRFLDVLEPTLSALGSEVSQLAETSHASRVRSPVCFLDQLADTLAVGGRKAAGCAQTRRRGAVLIHAAILLDLDAEMYERVFRVPAEEIRAGLVPAIPGIDPLKIGDAVGDSLADALGVEPRVCELEPVPEGFLEPYADPRWAPVT
jgi:lipoate-protein ligase A